MYVSHVVIDGCSITRRNIVRIINAKSIIDFWTVTVTLISNENVFKDEIYNPCNV